MISYADTVICIKTDRILETWPPIYRGQERPARDRLRLSQLNTTLILHTRIIMACLTDLYLRVHLTPSSPDPKSFIQDICRVNPRQLDYDVSLHKVAWLVVVIPTSPRSLKTEFGCSSYGCFGLSCFCLFQGQRIRPPRGGDSDPKCFFAIFIWSFGPKPLGTFSRPETLALGSKDSGRRDFWSGTRLCSGIGVFLAHGRRLGSGVSAHQWLVFVGDL
jgi:hypothetical protein